MTAATKSKSGLWLIASGIIVIGLGFYVWLNPETALLALSLYIGIIMIISGVSYFVAYLGTRSNWYFAQGVLNLLIGSIFVFNLGVTAQSLPIMFAFWCLFMGVVQLTSSFHEYVGQSSRIWTFMSGLSGIVFAYLILIYPFIGTVTISFLMGAYMILYGTLGLTECGVCRAEETESEE